MFDKDKMLELVQAEDYAYYKGDLVLSFPGLDQIRLFDALCESGVRTPEWWFNVLLADQDPLPEGIFD